MSELEDLHRRLRESPNPQDRELAKQYPLKRIKEIQQQEIDAFKASLDKKWINWLESIRK